MNARAHIARVERNTRLPGTGAEEFSGYGVMGLPFDSGYVLALRRFVVSSVGAGYHSVWLRDPEGAWTIYSDIEPRNACPRYLGPAIVSSVETPIGLEWTGPASFRVDIPAADFEWTVELGQGFFARAMTVVAPKIPAALWHRTAFQRVMGRAGGPMFRMGRFRLSGTMPAGQRFAVTPSAVWTIAGSRASLAGKSLGQPAPLPEQARLADFCIPQHGLFVVGMAEFTPQPTAIDAEVGSGA